MGRPHRVGERPIQSNLTALPFTSGGIRFLMPGNSALTRQEILAAADALFYSEGLRAVSVDEVAAKAGITKKTLYYHFRSKDELIAAYLQARDRPTLERFQKWAGSSGPMAERMVRMFKQLGRSALARLERLRLYPRHRGARKFPWSSRGRRCASPQDEVRSLARRESAGGRADERRSARTRADAACRRDGCAASACIDIPAMPRPRRALPSRSSPPGGTDRAAQGSGRMNFPHRKAHSSQLWVPGRATT